MSLFDLSAKLTLDSSEFDEGLDKAEKKGFNWGGALKNAAKVGAAAIGATTAAIGAFAKSSVDVGQQFDKSMAQVAATMGVTVDEIDDLRVFAQEMGSSTAFSASEAADALNYMALAGYDAETSMSMLPNVLNLAAAGGIELAYASDMITDSQSALGLSLEETSELVDKMAKASSKSNTSVAQLGEAILTVGANAQILSGGTTELSTALGIMADSGIKGAEGGTHLRNILLSLNPTTKEAVGAFNELGLNAYDADGNLRPLEETFSDLATALSTYSDQERTDILSRMFNRTDLAAINALLGASTDRVDSISASLESSGVAWEKYADQIWATEDVFSGLIDDLAHNTVLGTSAEELEKFLTFEYNLDASDAQAIIASMNDAIGDQSNRWDELSGYIDDAQGAAQAMADTQLDNLAGDITIFKSALEGAQIAVSDQLTPSLRDFVQFGTDVLSKLTQAFQSDGLEGAMQALGPIISSGLTMILEQVPMFINAGIKLFGAIGNGLIENAPLLVQTAFDLIVMLAEGLLSPQNITLLVETAVNLVAGFALWLSENADMLITAAVDMIIALNEALYDPNNLRILIDAAILLVLSLANSIIDNLDALIDAAPTIVLNLITAIVENAPKLLEAAVEIITQLVFGIIDNLPQVLSAGVDIVFEIVKGVLSVLNSVNKAGVSLFESLKNGFVERLDSVREWGANLLEGLWNGISDKVEWLKGKVSGVVDRIKGWFTGKDGFDEHSPSKWANDVFQKVLEGGAEGLDAAMPKMMKDVDDAVDRIKDGMNFEVASKFDGTALSQRGAMGSNITINVYGAEGQNIKELAAEVERRITAAIRRKEEAFA